MDTVASLFDGWMRKSAEQPPEPPSSGWTKPPDYEDVRRVFEDARSAVGDNLTSLLPENANQRTLRDAYAKRAIGEGGWGDYWNAFKRSRAMDQALARHTDEKGVLNANALLKEYGLPSEQDFDFFCPSTWSDSCQGTINSAILKSPSFRNQQQQALSYAKDKAFDWMRANPWQTAGIAGGGLLTAYLLGNALSGGDEDEDEDRDERPAWTSASRWRQ